MATSSALTLNPKPLALTLNHKPPISFYPSSLSPSLSPVSLPKKRTSNPLLTSSHLNNPSIPIPNSNNFSQNSQKDPDFSPFRVASSSPTERTSLQVETFDMSERDEQKRAASRPPSHEAHLLIGRVIFVEFPLVSYISELIVAQLLYLQGMNPTEPIYMHIASSGIVNEDGDAIALESEGFAIYDTMMSIKNEIHTFLMGTVVGHAALLAAAGTKGKRYMMPNAIAVIQEPRMPAFGEMQTSDLVVRAREALIQRNKFAEILGKHTGNSPEEIKKLIKPKLFLRFSEAKEFGLVDDTYELGKYRRRADVPRGAEWKNRGKDLQSKSD